MATITTSAHAPIRHLVPVRCCSKNPRHTISFSPPQPYCTGKEMRAWSCEVTPRDSEPGFSAGSHAPAKPQDLPPCDPVRSCTLGTPWLARISVKKPQVANKTKALFVSSLMRSLGLLEQFKGTNVNHSQGPLLCRPWHGSEGPPSWQPALSPQPPRLPLPAGPFSCLCALYGLPSASTGLFPLLCLQNPRVSAQRFPLRILCWPAALQVEQQLRLLCSHGGGI